jgi:hypothetical protein
MIRVFLFRNNDIPYTSEVKDSSAATEIVHDICVQLVEKIDIMLELQPQIFLTFTSPNMVLL